MLFGFAVELAGSVPHVVAALEVVYLLPQAVLVLTPAAEVYPQPDVLH